MTSQSNGLSFVEIGTEGTGKRLWRAAQSALQAMKRVARL
jgi:hypothetical protein